MEDAAEPADGTGYLDASGSSFVGDRGRDGSVAYDAIMTPVCRIAEGASRLSDEVKRQMPETPWGDIAGFGNFVAHGYRDIDRGIAWKAAVVDIPELAAALGQYLKDDPARGPR